MRAHIRWTVREFKFDAKAVEAGKEDLKKHESKRVKQKVNAHICNHIIIVVIALSLSLSLCSSSS
jgi:hypothetical protein